MHFAFFVFHFVIDRMRKQLLMSILDVIHIFFALFPLHTVLLKISQCQILKYLVQAIIDAVHNIFWIVSVTMEAVPSPLPVSDSRW